MANLMCAFVSVCSANILGIERFVSGSLPAAHVEAIRISNVSKRSYLVNVNHFRSQHVSLPAGILSVRRRLRLYNRSINLGVLTKKKNYCELFEE